MTETIQVHFPAGDTCDVPREKLLEALYNLNKHAKKYARLGTENYRNGKKATAKQNSVRKTALYRLKQVVVEGLVRADEQDDVERHRIDGKVYLCHYFGEWSYHTPCDKWSGPEPDVAREKELDSFTSTEQKERSDMSLKAALTFIETQTGESANEYLPQERVSYGHQSYFTGWSYLDG